MNNVIAAPYLYLGLVIRQVLFFYFNADCMDMYGRRGAAGDDDAGAESVSHIGGDARAFGI